jgi:hypothetical protein
MFCIKSKSNNYNNSYEISLINDIILPIFVLIILLSIAFTNTIIGIIIKQEDEKSNILLLLPLILIIILNIYKLDLNMIRMSLMFLALGYVIYDTIILLKGNNMITNLIYLLVSVIQFICCFISVI